MGAPGPQIPATNAYCAHFHSSVFAEAASKFLGSLKVATRIIPESGGRFFDATAAVVDSAELERLAARPDSHCLLLVSASGKPPPAGAEMRSWPDLWLVENPDGLDETELAGAWIENGAGAVVVSGPKAAAWESRNGAFGKSAGDLDAGNGRGSVEAFAAGVLAALVEELLGETLFDKTTPALDRECVQMRPLRLGRAVESGLAAGALEGSPAGWSGVQERLRLQRAPVPASWGGRTR